jgi:hypothetical protein
VLHQRREYFNTQESVSWATHSGTPPGKQWQGILSPNQATAE